ncbi:hypothetical protein OP10G_3029 [Fimbriimonas ginsengisoli Gsoil 348]|uniref:Uncharacterized protein n=1 Tax=Fimbriimonas ginsengisoli Gsoil 348 TaxID=661478 RepID=A0A068NSR0_FIMGI|nr:hypothetical protein OP10G_3029 [Fimbriimonas ginsengisoli Gsoil 348]
MPGDLLRDPDDPAKGGLTLTSIVSSLLRFPFPEVSALCALDNLSSMPSTHFSIFAVLTQTPHSLASFP